MLLIRSKRTGFDSLRDMQDENGELAPQIQKYRHYELDIRYGGEAIGRCAATDIMVRPSRSRAAPTPNQSLDGWFRRGHRPSVQSVIINPPRNRRAEPEPIPRRDERAEVESDASRVQELERF
jgi:hypothetical protein